MGDEAYRRVRPPNTTCDYVLLRSEQVNGSFWCLLRGLNVLLARGNALMIFVKSELTSVIRTVEQQREGVFFSCWDADTVFIHLCHRRLGCEECLGTKDRCDSPPVSRYELLFYNGPPAAGHPNVEERKFRLSNYRESLRFQKGRLSAVTSESPPFVPRLRRRMTGMPQGTWSGWETQITG